MVLAIAALAVPASASRQQDSELRFSLARGEVDSLDPGIWYYLTMWTIANVTCTNLLRYPDVAGTPGKALVPGLAQGPPRVSGGGKVYTFRIRPGLRFSNGKPLGPAAIKWSFERTVNPGLGGPAPAFFSDIVGAQAVIEGKAKRITGITTTQNSITFRLVAPNGSFLRRLAMPFACPVPEGTPPKRTDDGSLPSSGPYMISDYTPNRQMILERNPNYSAAQLGQRGKVDRFVITIGTDPAQILAKIKSGELDFSLTELPASAKVLALRDPSLRGRVFSNPVAGTYYFWMNNDVPPFDNAKVRQAVNYAIDRTQIVKVNGGPGTARATDQILPPTMPGSRDFKIYPATPNLAKAMALIRQSGAKLPANITINVYSNYSTHPAIAQVIQQNLKPLGINAKLNVAPANVLGPEEDKRSNRIPAGIGTWTQDYPDPDNFLNILLDPRTPDAPSPKARFHAREMIPTFNRVTSLTGEKRYSEYQKLDQKMMRDYAPWAPLFNPVFVHVVSSRLGGYIYHPVYNSINLAQLFVK
jgi:ABC-type transport system substrate-binding protein